jgi:DNA-binding beta-propeller fold protein YncE
MSFGAGGTLLTVEDNSRVTRRDPDTGAVIHNFNLITSSAYGVAEDAAGFVYVSGGNSNQLTRYNADGTGGVVLTVNGGTLATPLGIEFDNAGRLLVMNRASSVLARYTVAGTTLALDSSFGSAGQVLVPGSPVSIPIDVACDPVTDRVYVSLMGNNAI